MMDYCKILKETKTIAVVGISRNPYKTSHSIAQFLRRVGYTVYGVNPNMDREIEGIKVYKSLRDIDGKIDIVNVFRRSEDIPEIIDDVLAVNPKVLWLQLGIQNDVAVKPVKEKGIITIQNTCIMVAYNSC